MYDPLDITRYYSYVKELQDGWVGECRVCHFRRWMSNSDYHHDFRMVLWHYNKYHPLEMDCIEVTK